MEVERVIVASPNFLEGQTLGSVTVEYAWEGPVNLNDEVAVTLMSGCEYRFGVVWYSTICQTQGVLDVTADRIHLKPTAPIVFERAAWWRRLGYWLLMRAGCRRAEVDTQRSVRSASRLPYGL